MIWPIGLTALLFVSILLGNAIAERFILWMPGMGERRRWWHVEYRGSPSWDDLVRPLCALVVAVALLACDLLVRLVL